MRDPMITLALHRSMSGALSLHCELNLAKIPGILSVGCDISQHIVWPLGSRHVLSRRFWWMA